MEIMEYSIKDLENLSNIKAHTLGFGKNDMEL